MALVGNTNNKTSIEIKGKNKLMDLLELTMNTDNLKEH